MKTNIIDLIDTYAEARHTHGSHEYNAETNLARQAVVDALSAPIITLNGYQLLQALDFIAPDRTPEQLETQSCIQFGPERKNEDDSTDGPGYFCWYREYPEDGSILLSMQEDLNTWTAPSTPEMMPPATSRDRWMYRQGWLAALDPRSHKADDPDAATPGQWRVRKLVRDGKVVDCIVVADDVNGFSYDAEILGDDEYRDEAGDGSGFNRKLADCELIVSAVNLYRSAQAAPSIPSDGIYVASRASIPERPALWRALRDNGWPITSTWIDEAGEGETANMTELWRRIHAEISRSAGVLLYARKEDFPLKGALVECGIAIGMGKPVAMVLGDVQLEPRTMKPIGSWVAHPLVSRYQTIDEAKASLLAHHRREHPAWYDALALQIARNFTHDTFPKARASLHVAVIDAMKAAGSWRY